jgi:hypothetical protein
VRLERPRRLAIFSAAPTTRASESLEQSCPSISRPSAVARIWLASPSARRASAILDTILAFVEEQIRRRRGRRTDAFGHSDEAADARGNVADTKVDPLILANAPRQ